jgi:hypothetical protein
MLGAISPYGRNSLAERPSHLADGFNGLADGPVCSSLRAHAFLASAHRFVRSDGRLSRTLARVSRTRAPLEGTGERFADVHAVIGREMRARSRNSRRQPTRWVCPYARLTRAQARPLHPSAETRVCIGERAMPNTRLTRRIGANAVPIGEIDRLVGETGARVSDAHGPICAIGAPVREMGLSIRKMNVPIHERCAPVARIRPRICENDVANRALLVPVHERNGAVRGGSNRIQRECDQSKRREDRQDARAAKRESWRILSLSRGLLGVLAVDSSFFSSLLGAPPTRPRWSLTTWVRRTSR